MEATRESNKTALLAINTSSGSRSKPTAIQDLFVEVAARAIALQTLTDIRRGRQQTLSTAYRVYRERNHKGAFLQKETPEWRAMLEASAPMYAAVADARRAETNAKRRLERAVRKASAAVKADGLIGKLMASARDSPAQK